MRWSPYFESLWIARMPADHAWRTVTGVNEMRRYEWDECGEKVNEICVRGKLEKPEKNVSRLGSIHHETQWNDVNRCGAGGSMRACHAAGPDSIPVGTSFLGEVFSGFFLTCKPMSGSFRPPWFPNILWPSYSSKLIHYGRQWPQMLTRPKTHT